MLKRALALAWFALAACSHPRTITSGTSIEIYDPIVFATGSDQLPANTTKTLDSVASTFKNDPSITKVSVEAHTAPSDAATAPDRLALGTRRSQAILDQLVARGVERARLVVGTADDGTDAIAFIILERKPDSDPAPAPAR